MLLDSPAEGNHSKVYIDSHYIVDSDRDVLILYSLGNTGLIKAIC